MSDLMVERAPPPHLGQANIIKSMWAIDISIKKFETKNVIGLFNTHVLIKLF